MDGAQVRPGPVRQHRSETVTGYKRRARRVDSSAVGWRPAAVRAQGPGTRRQEEAGGRASPHGRALRWAGGGPEEAEGSCLAVGGRDEHRAGAGRPQDGNGPEA